MIESLISDLAFILILGAIVTVLFKWIKQPVVLGYIVAGFLASPNFTYLPTVAHADNIDFWAEIGIVVLLFSLGLEFSFKKLLSTGGSAIVTALIIVVGMMIAGFSIGQLLGFSNINSIFLGGMLSMSSTTIILKALTDLGLRHRKFASQVFAVLIVEDLFAVLMMVILSSIAINKTVAGGEMLFSVAKLTFFLIIWFLVGTYVLPSALNAVRRYLSDETLLVVAMGLCLGMAVFSVFCGFSLALGAFVMGSILAGTSLAERIEHVISPVKDLFGAVFFISVGMMVNPGVIGEYWQPILVLSAVVIVGMIIFGTFGMLVTGQNLHVAIQSGFALTQIGEFSFIIATLGMGLGVLESNIYPIVVAVSVITTFTTPYFIRLSDPTYNFVEKYLPKKWRFLIDRYSSSASHESETRILWHMVLRRYAWRVVLYGIVLIAICLVSSIYLDPIMRNLITSPTLGKLAWSVVTLSAMSPFLLALCYPASKATERARLVEANAKFDVRLVVMGIRRLLLAMGFVVYVISHTAGWAIGGVLGATLFTLGFIFISRRVHHRLARIESKFLNNLNERELRRSGANNNLVSDMHMAYVNVGYDCQFVGERLAVSNVRKHYGISIASIQRGGVVIPVPGGNERIFPGDTVGIIGTEEQIQTIIPLMEAGENESSQSSRNSEDVKFTSVQLSEKSPLIGKTVATADFRNTYNSLIVAIERDKDFIRLDGNEPFQSGDVIWLVAQPSVLSKLK